MLTAGTTVTGAVDPLARAADAAWRHVDAAWAGPLRLSERHAWLLDGIEAADSVAVSGHKWLFQPKESALVLFADAERAHEAISFGGQLPGESRTSACSAPTAPRHCRSPPRCSPGAGRGPPSESTAAWTSPPGSASWSRRTTRLELYSGPETGVVVWRPLGAGDLDELRARMQRGFVSIDELAGERRLRSVSANPMADPELVVAEVLRAATRLARTRSS